MIDSNHNRAFHYAVLASLALHALLLFGLQNLPDPARRAVRFPPPIVARLIDPEPVPAPVQALNGNEVPRAKPAAPRVSRPESAQQSKPAPAVPAPQFTAAPSTPTPPAESASSSVASEPPPLASVEPRPASPAPSAEAPESLSRDQYRVELIDEARRYKRYPPLARENNWEGGVLVGVVIGANGRASVSVKASSGHEVLDRQALEMFRQAARAVPIPPALRGKEFALEVRAVYGLED